MNVNKTELLLAQNLRIQINCQCQFMKLTLIRTCLWASLEALQCKSLDTSDLTASEAATLRMLGKSGSDQCQDERPPGNIVFAP